MTQIKTTAFLLVLCLILTHCNQPQSTTEEASKEDTFQNIVFIIGDDHSANVLGCYGNDLIRTPNLDRMAARGVRFTQAYANAPLCSASRQSMLTGRYPHAAGVTLLRTSFPEEQITLADHLKNHGFATGLVGKNHFNNNLNHGFDYKIERNDYRAQLEANPPRTVPESIQTRPPWKPFRDPARIWLNADNLPGGFYDKDDIGTYYANTAVDFINQHKENRFLLWVGFHEPHSPFNFPVEYAGKYNPEEMPLPTGSPEDDRWIPEEFKDLTDEERRGIIAAYYASVEYLDKNVGLILDGLEAAGLDENTLVVYVGDHGYLLNDHKRFEKHMMWEPAVQAPLIIQAGGKYGEGRAIDNLTEFVDLVPTLIEAVGIAPIEAVQGKSLMPLLNGKTDEHKEYVFSEFLADNKAMVRSKEWKYIFTTGQRDLGQGYATGNPPPGITHRLYDQINDPDETRNLSSHPEYLDIVENMQQEMIAWFEATHPKADAVADTLTVEEKLVLYCEPPEGNEGIGAQ